MRYPRFCSFFITLGIALLMSACGGGGDDAGDDDEDEPPTNTNTQPQANDQSLSTDEDAALAITLTGSDADGDELIFAVTVQPGNGSLTGTAPDLTYTPNTDYVGGDSFTFTVNDGTEDSAEATVSITINEVTPPPPANTAPQTNDQSLSTDENAALAITLSGSDADGDSLSFSVTAQPGNGSLTGTAPDLTYTPNTDYVGSDSFSFSANDGTEDSAGATVSITVNQAYFSIGGTVTGLVNTGLFLENNGGDNLEVAGVSFEFPTRLPDGGNYSVTVADHPEHQLCSMDNAAGTVAGADVEDVSVLCRYWRTAGLIETDNAGDARDPQIAVDGDGNAIAVWWQDDGTRFNIQANTWSPDSGWGTAVLLETDNAGHARFPQVAVDSAGNAIAVWYQDAGTRNNIWANTYSPDSGWGMAALIETDDGGAFEPQIAVDSAGNAIAVWRQHDGTAYSIWANAYTPDSGWGTAALIETDNAGDAINPQIAVDSAGNAIAVWSQWDGTAYSIWANTGSPDSGWGTAALIETDNVGDAFYPQIAVDSAGNAIAVWRQSDGTRVNIRANAYTPDSGWGTEELIETDDAGNAERPQIAVDSAGNAIAVWYQHDGTRNNIWANTYTPDNGWGTAALIETDNGGNAANPQLAVDSASNAIAVWQQHDGTRNNIWANTSTPDKGWGTATLIETDDAGNAGSPQIAVDSAGNAIAVWRQSDGTRDSIQANRFE